MKKYAIYNVMCDMQLDRSLSWRSRINTVINDHLFTDSEIENLKSTGAIHWDIQPVYKQAIDESNGKPTGYIDRFWN